MNVHFCSGTSWKPRFYLLFNQKHYLIDFMGKTNNYKIISGTIKIYIIENSGIINNGLINGISDFR